jgi:serine/threonine-protein kinase 24/25/MST4
MDCDEVLEQLQKKYGLSDAHKEYLRKEVDDACDMDEARAVDELKNIEKELTAAEYLLTAKIGSGAFGSVYKGKRKKDDKVVAIKIIDLEESKDDITTITREITALVNGKTCPQLTNYYGSVVFGTKLWIAMEYLDGGSLLDKVKDKPLTEAQIAVTMREVLLGLQYLNSTGKIHRDIKAANILLSKDGQVKLADFGASTQLTDTMTKCNTFVGSPYWMAPEILTQNNYDGKADIWSLGITCLELTTGKPPLSEITPLKVITVIPTKPPPEPDKTKFSKNFVDFVAVCLTKDPKARPTTHVLLKHPLIAAAGDKSLLVSVAGTAPSGKTEGKDDKKTETKKAEPKKVEATNNTTVKQMKR